MIFIPPISLLVISASAGSPSGVRNWFTQRSMFMSVGPPSVPLNREKTISAEPPLSGTPGTSYCKVRKRIRGRDHTQVGGLGNTSPPTSATPGSLVAVETVQPVVDAAGDDDGVFVAWGAGGPVGTEGPCAVAAGLVDAGGLGAPTEPSPHPAQSTDAARPVAIRVEVLARACVDAGFGRVVMIGFRFGLLAMRRATVTARPGRTIPGWTSKPSAARIQPPGRS